MAQSTIAQLAVDVGNRLQDPTFTFWRQNYEAYSAIAEAIDDLMLIVGRPTIQFNTIITLTPNTVWQPMPANMIAITNLRGSGYSLWKTTLHAMDYLQASWGPDWESDIADVPARWGSLGLTYFFVHPAPSTAIQVSVSGVTNPITTAWPPTGAETSPFNNEFNVALQLYATAYCRLKELSDDALEGDVLYQQYIELAARMTQIADRRDPLIFSRSFGTPTAPSMVTLR